MSTHPLAPPVTAAAAPAPPAAPPLDAPPAAPSVAAPSVDGTQRVLRLVRRLRWALPALIFAFVVAHQAWLALGGWGEGAAERFLAGVLVYGLVGPFVTYRTLDWIARAAEAQAAVEARARRGERTLASITAGSADAIIGLDTDGIVRSWNRGAGEILGYASEWIVGKPIELILPPAAQPHGALAHIRQRLDTHGYVRGGQVRCRRSDGRTVPVDITQTLLRDERGRVVGSSLILRDMTSRVAAERAVLALNQALEARVAERTAEVEAAGRALRRQNDALEAANAELSRLDAVKDEFVALVSHELRAPLTNILASVELLLMREDDPDRRAKLDIVGQEAGRLTRLVRGVLDVSRLQAGRLDLQRAPVDPAELVRAAVDRVDAAGRPVRLDVAPDAPPVMADFDRAVQVLVNLLENAVKYSPPGSEVEVAAIPAASDDAPAGTTFRVTDHGVGIPADEQARIFDRFHRVERGDDRETYGHGLGLHIARGLVAAHGGTIAVESAPGRGATFRVTLPAADAGALE